MNDAERTGQPQGTEGPQSAQREGTADQGNTATNPGSGKKKQLSGHQKRMRRRLRALHAGAPGALAPPRTGPVMPAVPTEAELGSLTGVAREASRMYRAWRRGEITHGDLLAASRVLAEHRGTLAAIDEERRTAAIERAAQLLAQQQPGSADPYAVLREAGLLPGPKAAEPEGATIEGEVAP